VTRLPPRAEVHADAVDVAASASREQRPAAEASSVLGVIGAIASQTVLVTGLLYYFGWVRAQVGLGYFGVDPTLAGYSSPDYMLRSIDVTFLPFVDAAVIALLLLALHRLVVVPALNRAGSDSPVPPTGLGSTTGPTTGPDRAHRRFIHALDGGGERARRVMRVV